MKLAWAIILVASTGIAFMWWRGPSPICLQFVCLGFGLGLGCLTERMSYNSGNKK